MKVELERSLALPVPASGGWALLGNIEGLASCMPGAKITERLDETHYKGTITVKLGPATVNFRGELEVVSFDPAMKSIRIVGKGSDTTGGSGASLDLTASVKETGPETCELSGRSEVNVTGKVAAFGGRLMNTVTDQLLKIFFANLLVKAAALETTATAEMPEAAAAPVETKFNALAFVWSIIKDSFRGLFHKTKTS